MAKVLVIHGPNLNMLGTREPEIYGHETLADVNEMMIEQGKAGNVEVECRQSNHEGTMVDWIQQAAGEGFSFIILNAGAYTHYSIAIRDAIASINVPVIEVHLSNVHKREEFRHKSVIAPVVMGQILGFGVDSYYAALAVAMRKLQVMK